MYYAEVIYGVNDCAHDSLRGAGGVEAGNSTVAAWPAALAAKM